MAYQKECNYPYVVDDGYNVGYHETHLQMGASGTTERKPKWNWGTHICSTLTMLCCCWCLCFSSMCGLCGLIFSIGSYTDYKSADYEGYKYKKCCAIAWMIMGLVFGLGTLAAIGYFGYTYYQTGLDLVAGLQKQLEDLLKSIADAQSAAAAASAAAAGSA